MTYRTSSLVKSDLCPTCNQSREVFLCDVEGCDQEVSAGGKYQGLYRHLCGPHQRHAEWEQRQETL